MKNLMKVICSSSQSDVGVGNMFVITVDMDSDWYDDDNMVLTDSSGVQHEVYDYITEIDLPNRMG